MCIPWSCTDNLIDHASYNDCNCAMLNIKKPEWRHTAGVKPQTRHWPFGCLIQQLRDGKYYYVSFLLAVRQIYMGAVLISETIQFDFLCIKQYFQPKVIELSVWGAKVEQQIQRAGGVRSATIQSNANQHVNTRQWAHRSSVETFHPNGSLSVSADALTKDIQFEWFVFVIFAGPLLTTGAAEILARALQFIVFFE